MSTSQINAGRLELERLFCQEVTLDGDRYVIDAGSYTPDRVAYDGDSRFTEGDNAVKESLLEMRFFALTDFLKRQGVRLHLEQHREDDGHDVHLSYSVSQAAIEKEATIKALKTISPTDIDPCGRGGEAADSDELFRTPEQRLIGRLNSATYERGVHWTMTGAAGDHMVSTVELVEDPCAVIDALEAKLHASLKKPPKGSGHVTIPLAALGEREDLGARLSVLSRPQLSNALKPVGIPMSTLTGKSADTSSVVITPSKSALQKASRDFLLTGFPNPSDRDGQYLSVVQMITDHLVPLMKKLPEKLTADRDAVLELPKVLLRIQQMAYKGTQLEATYGAPTIIDSISLTRDFKKVCDALRHIAKEARDPDFDPLDKIGYELALNYDTTLGRTTHQRVMTYSR
jgi:hypothetical protein